MGVLGVSWRFRVRTLRQSYDGPKVSTARFNAYLGTKSLTKVLLQ